MTRTLGGAFSGQLAATLLAGNLGAGGAPTADGFTLAFLMCLAALVAALGFAIAVPRRAAARLQPAPAVRPSPAPAEPERVAA